MGVRLVYPEWWELSPDDSGGGLVRIVGDPGISRLTIFTTVHNPDVALIERLGEVVELVRRQDIAEDIQPEVELTGLVTLTDGSDAERADITHPSEDGPILHRVQVTERGWYTFGMVLTTQAEDEQRWQKPYETMFSSLASSQPELYGIERGRGFIMPLGEPSTMDPALVRETTSHLFVSNVFSGLVRFDSELNIVPDLAEGWEVDEAGVVYTFTLRDGITFQDGHPITADDFKYSIERASEPELHSDTVPLYLGDIVGMREKLEGEATEVSGVEVVDERTIRITIDSPKDYFLAKLSYPSSAVVDRRAVEELGDNWWMGEEINGSGPYRLLRWDSGEVVILQRYDGYHTPAMLEYLISPLVTLVGASGLDMYVADAWDALYIGTRTLGMVRTDPELRADLNIYDQLITYFVVMDGTRPPFDDPNVRRAFAMALDREQLVEEVHEGSFRVATGLLPPGIPAYSESLRGIPYDPGMARQLLAESPYADDLPEIIFTAPDYSGEPPANVQFMIDSWKEELGADVVAGLIDPDNYFYQLENLSEHLYIYGWVADYPDPENFLDLLLHSEAHDSKYANEEFDTLVEQARTEQDPEARLALFRQAEQLLMDDAGIIPLHHVQDFALVQPYIQGFTTTALGQPAISGITLDAMTP